MTRYQNLQTIASTTDPFIGGFCSWWYTLRENVLQWPEVNPVTQKLSDEPILKAGKAWYGPVNVPDTSVGYTETQEVDRSGLYYKQRVTGIIPGNDAASHINLQNLTYHQFIIIGKVRAGGFFLMVGGRYAGMRLDHETTTGDGQPGAPGTKLAFTTQSAFKAKVLSQFSLGNVVTVTGCPIVTYISLTSTGFTGVWTAISGATLYFYKLTLVGDPEAIQQGSTAGLSHVFSSLSANTAYHLFIYPYVNGAFVSSCLGITVTTPLVTTFAARWGYQLTDPSANMGAAAYQYTGDVTLSGAADIQFAGIPGEQFFYFEYPDTEADYTLYDMGYLVNAALPDQTFKRVTQGSKKYLVTRDQQTFTLSQILFHR